MLDVIHCDGHFHAASMCMLSQPCPRCVILRGFSDASGGTAGVCDTKYSVSICMVQRQDGLEAQMVG